MIINGRKFAESEGNVKSVFSNFGLQADSRLYNREERTALSPKRAETQLQSDIYNLPNSKTLLVDLDNRVSNSDSDR